MQEGRIQSFVIPTGNYVQIDEKIYNLHLDKENKKSYDTDKENVVNVIEKYGKYLISWQFTDL